MNYEKREYIFEKTILRYVITEDKEVFMLLIPNGTENMINDRYETVKDLSTGFPNHRDWFAGSIAHLHLSHHYTPMYENGYKLSESTKKLKFHSQSREDSSNYTEITTIMKADEGYEIVHKVKHFEGENGFEVSTEFVNNTGREVVLEMLTSASLDGLSPYGENDGSEDFIYHTFKGGWSTEGKMVSRKLSEFNMEKSWGGSFESEKVGSIGSKTVGRFYPYAALEDTVAGVTWGIKIKHNASWQIELSRMGTPLSLSCGMADFKFGHWRKKVANGESYGAPIAYIAAAKGGIDAVSNDLLKMNDRDIDAYGEEGMPIIFNDWVTHWGDTSHEKLISLANALKDSKVKYFVVDDGWQTGGVGDWKVDMKKFPKGLKEYCSEIRQMGKIPGIWMEFECVRDKAERWADEYNKFYLTKDGMPINNAASNCAPTKFLDFRKKEVREFLEKAVIEHLKENEIGYMKVDYNSNIGLGCDGADSLGEGLKEQMDAVYEFFKHIKEEIPEIIIENCSTGGSRLEPKMMSVTAMSSFSDAHESIEVPVIAANLNYLISPRQSQVWCVLKEYFPENQMQYVIASGFLGRLCWSGNIDKLSENQMKMLYDAENFYETVSDIIKSGRSTVIRTNPINNRKPQGSQLVVRYSEDGKKALAVCHFFENSKQISAELCGKYKVKTSLYENGDFVLDGTKISFSGKDMSANVILLEAE